LVKGELVVIENLPTCLVQIGSEMNFQSFFEHFPLSDRQFGSSPQGTRAVSVVLGRCIYLENGEKSVLHLYIFSNMAAYVYLRICDTEKECYSKTELHVQSCSLRGSFQSITTVNLYLVLIVQYDCKFPSCRTISIRL
jgi:hypothetical protein